MQETNLVACLWTFSRTSMSFLKCAAQTWIQYSRWVCWVQYEKHFFIQSNEGSFDHAEHRHSLTAAELHWLLHFMSSVIKIPRSLFFSNLFDLLYSVDICQIVSCLQGVSNRHFVAFLCVELQKPLFRPEFQRIKIIL